jgi:hypothetical protein
MSIRVCEVLLGARIVQPQGFLRRRELVRLEEALEHEVTLLS